MAQLCGCLAREADVSMSIINRLIKNYRKSSENRIQFIIFLGFVIVPIIGMALLYIIVNIFWL